MTDVISTEDKLREAARELKVRCSLYPRWIKAGKLKPDEAAKRIAIQEQIVADYEQSAGGRLL